MPGIGYDGFISGEFMPRPDASAAVQRAIQHLAALDQVRLADAVTPGG